MLYLALKSFHLVAVISWMAGMLYLPRLFIYHHSKPVGSDASETFKIMERRLAKGIMMPALIATWVAGLSLLAVQGPAVLHSPWMALKLLAVLAMTWIHMKYLGYLRQFAADERPRTPRFFRILNEGPTVLMIVIVILVVFKPGFGF